MDTRNGHIVHHHHYDGRLGHAAPPAPPSKNWLVIGLLLAIVLIGLLANRSGDPAAPVKEEAKPAPVKEEAKPAPVKENPKPAPVKENPKPAPSRPNIINNVTNNVTINNVTINRVVNNPVVVKEKEVIIVDCYDEALRHDVTVARWRRAYGFR